LTGDTDGAGLAVKYGYDLDGNVTSLTHPGASGRHVVSYAFNKADQETSLTDWLGLSVAPISRADRYLRVSAWDLTLPFSGGGLL
jgi:YD repeat-containing protein